MLTRKTNSSLFAWNFPSCSSESLTSQELLGSQWPWCSSKLKGKMCSHRWDQKKKRGNKLPVIWMLMCWASCWAHEHIFDRFKSSRNSQTSLVMQWLRFPASTAGGGTGSNPGQGTKTQHAMWHGKKFVKKKFSQPPFDRWRTWVSREVRWLSQHYIAYRWEPGAQIQVCLPRKPGC